MPSIVDLPTEILLHIANYLGPVDTANLKLTCSALLNIFSDEFYWKHYAQKYLNETFPPIYPKNSRYCWEWSLCEYMKECSTWSREQNDIRSISLNNIHCASIDAVQLSENSRLCMTGSRDRTLALWDTKSILKHNLNTPLSLRLNAHTGWIWDLHEDDGSTLYSASWDKTVKSWDIATNLTNLSTMNCCRTALSVVVTQCKLVAVGLYNGAMNLFDPATSRLIGSYNFHKKPIYEMATYENFIFTASQDRKLGIFDLRSWQAVTYKILRESLPLSLSVCSELLYVGDSWGNLHLFDSQTFKKKATYNLISVGKKRQITGIRHSVGSIILSSTDGYVRIYSLSNPPKLILEHNVGGEAISLDYKNQIIAVGKANNAFELMTHKRHQFLQ
ncbi:uncharacterized protein CBL_14085 [Carabus blaptoides fortunei]